MMTESEKFYFKILQWIIALGTTLLLFGMGYVIAFIVNVWTWQVNHDKDSEIFNDYVIERLYKDSISCIEINKRISEIEQKLYREAMEVALRPRMEAVLPENKYHITPTKNEKNN